jgi:hypothetical protein
MKLDWLPFHAFPQVYNLYILVLSMEMTNKISKA